MRLEAEIARLGTLPDKVKIDVRHSAYEDVFGAVLDGIESRGGSGTVLVALSLFEALREVDVEEGAREICMIAKRAGAAWSLRYPGVPLW